MVRKIESILVFSENAKRLADFYKEKVGLKTTFEGEMGEDGQEVYNFQLGEGVMLGLLDHSEIKGRNKEPQRMMFNLEVDVIEDEVKKLETNKVKKIQDIYHVQDYGKIATFEDVDGNYFQLVQIRG